MSAIELENARRLIAAQERAKENVEKARKIIEDFYGLKAEYGEWFEEISPPAVQVQLLSPTGQTVAMFDVFWDEEGYVIPNRLNAGKGHLTGLAEVRLAIAKLAPKGQGYNR